jgi:type IV pilus assembly protein PilP
MVLRQITRNRRILAKCIAIALTAATLTACGGGDLTDLRDWVNDVKKKQKGVVEPLPEIKTVEPFVFKPEDLRDPFIQNEKAEQQEEEVKGDNGVHPDTARAKEELESYELDSLRMVGTVSQNGVLWGLVKAIDGTIHRVRVGNYMGRNFGKIIRIKDGEIELLEIIPDSPGGWRERKQSLVLSEASSGDKK